MYLGKYIGTGPLFFFFEDQRVEEKTKTSMSTCAYAQTCTSMYTHAGQYLETFISSPGHV